MNGLTTPGFAINILSFMSILSFLLISTAHAAEEVAHEAAATGGIGTLGLNAKFFIAQLVNFGILLLIFWKLILPKVVTALQNRSERIEQALKDAANTEKEKREFEVWKNAEMSKARQEASSIVIMAQTEAGKAKQVIVDQTKTEQQKLVDQAKAQIESEKNKALQEAKGELADLVTNATEKILRKKLDSKTDQELIKESLAQVK